MLVSDSLGPGYRIVLVFRLELGLLTRGGLRVPAVVALPGSVALRLHPSPHAGCATVSGPGQGVPRPALVRKGLRGQAFEGGTDVLIDSTVALTGEDWPSHL